MATAIQRHGDRATLFAPSFSVLGVRVDAVQIPEVVARVEEWIARQERCQYIAVTGMHGVTEAQHHAQFKTILNSAGLVVPDGMPLVWIGRRHGFDLPRRVYGPELMATFCKQTASKGYRHFFYGGAPGVAEDLASQFVSRFSGMVVAGTYSPPFRSPTPEEYREIIHAIEGAQPDIVWLRAFDGVNDFAILLRSRRTKRRAVSSRHYHAGKPGDKLRSEVLRNTRRATVKKMPVTL